MVKAIKKSSKGICVLAADVTPPDVISHLPILCEDNGIPYIFVRSRRELGISSETKKPTSVVLILEPPKDHQLADKFAKLHQKIKDNHPFM